MQILFYQFQMEDDTRSKKSAASKVSKKTAEDKSKTSDMDKKKMKVMKDAIKQYKQKMEMLEAVNK